MYGNNPQKGAMKMNFNELLTRIGEIGIDVGLKILASILIFVVGKIVIKLLVKFLKKEKVLKGIDISAKSFIISAVRAALYILLAVTVIAILGVPMATIVAAVGSAGLAIGLALQGGLSNIAGGILIIIFKPFTVGDYITVSGESGTVEKIDIFYTTIVTADNKRIVLPNSIVSSSAVTDYSAKDTRRVDLTFSAGYESDIGKVNEILLATARAHELVLQDPEPFARLGEQGDSALIFYCRVWCKNADYWTVYFDLTEKVKEAFDRNGISIPYPQLDIHNKQ
jgi:small conductance mechanosensitive channel